MNDQELKGFFWTPLLIVTGVSFLLFGEIMNFVGGSHADWFYKLGVAGILAGVLSFVFKPANKKARKFETD